MQPLKEDSMPCCSTKSDITELAALWKNVFNDTDEFINLFFRKKYRPENAVIIRYSNRIVAALHIVPYSIKSGDSIVPAAYICGVCTVKEERGKGLMNSIMKEAESIIFKRGYKASFLIPQETWLFDVYKKYGFSLPFMLNTEHITRQQALSVATLCENQLIRPFIINKDFRYFDSKQKERICTVLHDRDDLNDILYDTHTSGWSVLTVERSKNPVGVAFVQQEKSHKIMIKELLYDDEIAKMALIRYITDIYNVQEVEVRITNKAIATASRYFGLMRTNNQHLNDDLYVALMLE